MKGGAEATAVQTFREFSSFNRFLPSHGATSGAQIVVHPNVAGKPTNAFTEFADQPPTFQRSLDGKTLFYRCRVNGAVETAKRINHRALPAGGSLVTMLCEK